MDKPILVFMMLIVPPNMVFMVYHAIKDTREQPPAVQASAAADPGQYNGCVIAMRIERHSHFLS